jgi:hypothetical protein
MKLHHILLQMKKFTKSIIRQLISPSMRFKIRDEIAWTREQLRRACIWKWKFARFPLREDSRFEILFVGRKTRLEDAKLVLGAEQEVSAGQKVEQSRQKVFVSEFPVPGALFVPVHLGSVIPLGKSIEEIIEKYEKNVRTTIRKHREQYCLQRALTDAEIERADREMLRPYAKARYGSLAVQVAPQLVLKYVRDFGRLDYVMFGNEAVGCTLAYENTRAGKRYWISDRWGCPETVYSDPKRMSEINTVCTFLELERAIKDGFDYFDLGASYARPNEGTLQWKKRRGCELDTKAFHRYIYVQLPRAGSAQFLWDAPLFSVERHKLALHLGIPDGPSDEEVACHYREMGFRGLSNVYLHCARQPGERILNNLHGLYANQKRPPVMDIVQSA